MNRFSCFSVALWMLIAALPSLAQQPPVRIVGLVELSGTGATSGTNFDNGVKLAVKEINATGGILGRKVEYTSSDTQSAPQTAKALAQKAVDEGAYGVFVYTNEEESARALRELKKQGYDKPIIGETTLTSQKVIELAGDAANGAVAHVGLTADAPQPTIKAFDERFQKEYKYKTDHNGLKGYSAMYIVKAVTEKIGKFDPKAFAAAMHGVTLSTKDYPGVLLDVTFDQNGDLDRESFMTTVVNGKQQVVATLPAASAK